MQTIKHTLTKKERGFTLIELLVVIAIIAVLAALVLAALSSAQKGSRDTKRKSDLNQYKTALATYQNDNNGSYPGTAGAAAAVNSDTAQPYAALATGGQLTKRPKDPQAGTGATDSNSYYYVVASGNADYGMCTDLERGGGFQVGPTYSGGFKSGVTAETGCTVAG